MFGLRRRNDPPSTMDVTSAQLTQLVPFANTPPEALHSLAEQARLMVVRSGKIPGKWFESASVFLNSGQIELRAANERRVFLSSVSPPARFPLPAPDKARLLVVEPTTCIVIPDAASHALQPANNDARNEADDDPRLAELSRLIGKALHRGEIPIPSMPELATRLNTALHDDDSYCSRNIAKLIQLDPALASKIIFAVNSAAFRFASRAENVQQAVTRLGTGRVQNLAVGFLLRNAFQTKSAALRRRANNIWLNGCKVAAVSYTLARQLPMLDPERAMLAGLVHQIGALPVLALAQQYPQLASAQPLLDQVIRRFEKQLGLYLLEHWSLGHDLSDVVRHAGDWQRVGDALPDYTDVVLLAQLHARIGTQGFRELPRIDELPAFKKLELGKLSPRRSIEALEEAEREIAELQHILSNAG